VNTITLTLPFNPKEMKPIYNSKASKILFLLPQINSGDGKMVSVLFVIKLKVKMMK
jgi:hypothetical protein